MLRRFVPRLILLPARLCEIPLLFRLDQMEQTLL
jgi:hypothetical protein